MVGYDILRPALMCIDPETVHEQTIGMLKLISRCRRLTALENRLIGSKVPSLPVRVFDRTVDNPVGLAAGFDKNAVACKALSAMGFGFVELGTVTPEPQPGNSKKRMFRIRPDEAIINRLGFNSLGLEAFKRNLKLPKPSDRRMLVGINIGKNTATPNDRAIADYIRCLEGVYDFADYVTINISSPNSPQLRELQQADILAELLEAVMQKKEQLASANDGRQVPIALKISPDLETSQIESIARSAMRHRVDAIIATNTTITRPESRSHPAYQNSGGLSGRPLNDLSTRVIRILAEASNHSIPIIGVGGISTAADAWNKLMAGACLVQIYSALVYRGPTVVRDIVVGLKKIAEDYDREDFNSAVKQARKQQTAASRPI